MMARQLSKSDRIRKLLHLSNKEIAETIGCREEYVRTVRQRTSASGNPKNSNAVKAYNPKRYELRRKRYATDPSFREKSLMQNADWRRRHRRAEARTS
jgi:hypothetical protein